MVDSIVGTVYRYYSTNKNTCNGIKDTDESVTKTSSSHICKDKKMKGEFLWKILYLYWTRRPSRSYAKAGMNRPAGVKTAHSCGHTSS